MRNKVFETTFDDREERLQMVFFPKAHEVH